MCDPLVLFPVELWEIILNNLEDSTDVWNVFRAFPQLDNNPILHKKKPLWLFGLIIPILTPWKETRRITTKTLLNCRQTCRHWSTAIDTFLENQPQLRAYNNDNPTSGRFPWDTKTYKEDENLDSFQPERKVSNHIGGVKITNENLTRPKPHSLSSFLKAMDQHPPERNPFLSRSLCFNTSYSGSLRADDLEQFWNGMTSFHQKFGKHVWFYKLQFDDLDDFNRREYFANCIAQLTNLKSLHLMGSEYMGDDSSPDPNCPSDLCTLMKKLENGLPPFPHLETLKIDGDLTTLSHFLIQRFSSQAQIRRLELQLQLWQPEYSQLFPSLTELDLIDIDWERAGVSKLLLSLEAPQLSKLQLKFCEVMDDEDAGICEFCIEDDVFQWLKRFPMLRTFMFGEGCQAVRMKEKGTLEPEADSVKSLQFLSIRTSFGMSFKFLLCFPSLQHLNLFVPVEPVVIDHSNKPIVRIREALQTGKMYDSNIWELLPKLKTLNLLVEENYHGYIRASYDFYRDGYEKTKRAAALSAPTANVNFSRLRQDILDYYKMGKVRTGRNSSDYDTDDDDSDDDDDDELDGIVIDNWPIF